jgi:tetratricopeptide (TPR) repeat protein
MGWLTREKVYDRGRLLSEAARARQKGKRQKAIGLYRQVLAAEPENPDLHRRIAPLLAETRQAKEAWASYQRAAEGLAQKGFVEQAVGVLREASKQLKRVPELWLALADLEVERKRPIDAHQVLLEGRRHFRSRRDRQHAVLLLQKARKLQPRDVDTNLDLAVVLARSGARQRAQRLLDELTSFTRGRALRRVRARQLRLSPTPGAAWLWLRALLTGR